MFKEDLIKYLLIQGATVFYDDYAHHPTEIKELLKGVKEVYKKEEIVCCVSTTQNIKT